MSTIGEKIDNIRRLHPRGPNRYGQLYKSAATAQRLFRKVTLYTLFVSHGDEDSYLIRDHLFESKKNRRTPIEWHAWFGKNLTEIHRAGVLPGLRNRTGKDWSVLKIIGWSGDAHTSSAIVTGKRKPHGKRRTPGARRSK